MEYFYYCMLKEIKGNRVCACTQCHDYTCNKTGFLENAFLCVINVHVCSMTYKSPKYGSGNSLSFKLDYTSVRHIYIITYDRYTWD